MVIEVKKDELNYLISLLSRKMNSIITQAQCAVQLLANPTHRVFVDDMEDPIFVLLSPNQQHVEDCGISRYHLYIDDNDNECPALDVKLAKFLDYCNLNDSSKHSLFSAVNKREFNALSRYFASRVIRAEKRAHCNVLVFDNQAKIELPSLDEKFMLGSVRSEEIEEVNHRWNKSKFSKGFLTHSIANYPSVCIRDKDQGDRLACFIMASSCGLQTNLFTYPEYRNKGLAKAVTIAHAKLLEPIFGAAISTVEQWNTAAENMFKKLHFKLQIDQHAIWLETGEFT